MTVIKKITSYFKQSLVDAGRLSPEDKDLLPALGPDKSPNPGAPYIALDNRIWQDGQIAADLAKQIIAAKQPKGKPALKEIELVLFPRVDHLIVQGGHRTSGKRKVLLPLVVFVHLQDDGQLRPGSKAPWIPREWLAPNQSSTEPFGDMVVVDEFFTRNPFEGIDTWLQLVTYCAHLLCAAAGSEHSLGTEDFDQSTISLSEIPVHPDYKPSDQCLLQTEAPISGATNKILKVLDSLLGQAKTPLLYERFCAQASPALAPSKSLQYDAELAKVHLGQMTGEFPLSPKQRNALHHFLKQDSGEILAVNGPPGTGKTTLLRSVVAHLWAQAALDQGEPPLIMATSNNNQAVTNILESFAKVDEDGLQEELKGRWLPEVISYGLFCCASGKANEKNPYMYLGPKGDGCMQEWQTQDYLDKASTFFLDKVRKWHGGAIADIALAKGLLHRAILKTKGHIVKGYDDLAAFIKIEEEIDNKYGGLAAFMGVLQSTEQSYLQIETKYKLWNSRLIELFGLWELRSFWIRLLLWLPPIGKPEQRKNARLLMQWEMHLDEHDDDAVETCINSKIQEHRQMLESIKGPLTELRKLADDYKETRAALDTWIRQHRPEKIFTTTLVDQVNEINDRVNRFTLFKLATHYWEARWLIECKEFLASGDEDKKSPLKILRKLRRFAKLTPCFVSTFYMLPSTFIAGSYQDGTWMDIPLFSEIDLLIIDEAGQASPEVAAASFALAKRALVVGDTDQIEPVWSVPASIDRSNLKLFDLLGSEQKYASLWLPSGLLASSGNVMRIAQRQCRHHQFSQLQRGLYLTEHRRCYDSIVGYCNDLVYKGVLEPLRGEPKHEVPWGTMSMIPVSQASTSYGGSRGNAGEAKEIARWLSSEVAAIIRYARDTNPTWAGKSEAEVLKLAVGIITPFSKQAALIRNELKTNGIEGLTVGTVHSLQGDERVLILFSSVYGDNDRALGKFYDNGPNMLNVAVSRAKDSFVVFGHTNVFGAASAGSPSGLLRSKLSIQPY